MARGGIAAMASMTELLTPRSLARIAALIAEALGGLTLLVDHAGLLTVSDYERGKSAEC